jgi:hypothetical protein
MRSPLARWKPRHLFGAWLGYWAVLAAVTLTPAAIAMWKVTRDGVKGSANVSLGDAGLHVTISLAGATIWDATVAVSTLALAIAGPPLVLWLCWLLSTSASRDSAAEHAAEQLGSGDELPLRHDDRVRDATR